MMKKKRKRVSQRANGRLDLPSFPRRGFLQRSALVTGAFLIGVFRLDKVIGNSDKWDNPCDNDEVEDDNRNPAIYCCNIDPNHYDANCPIDDEKKCKTIFYWTCNWCDRSEDIPYIIRCVECFDVKIPERGRLEPIQCLTKFNSNYNDIRCSIALHPDHKHYTYFR